MLRREQGRASRCLLLEKEKSAAIYEILALVPTPYKKSVPFSKAQSSKLDSRSADTTALQEQQNVASDFMNDVMESHVKNVQDIVSKTTLKIRSSKAIAN